MNETVTGNEPVTMMKLRTRLRVVAALACAVGMLAQLDKDGDISDLVEALEEAINDGTL